MSNLTLFSYKLLDIDIARVTITRDLNMTFDNKLLFDHHVNEIISKASKAPGFILRMS